MDYISNIKSIFSQPSIRISERAKCVDLFLETDTLPKYNELYELICSFPSRDNVKISLSDITDEKFIFGNRKNIISEDNYHSYLSVVDVTEKIEININIEKEISDNQFSVYCYDSFINDICTLSIFDALATFANLLNGLDKLHFVVYDNSCSFMTKTMYFSSEEKIVFNNDFSRINRLQQCHDVSRFYCDKKLELIPEDFKIIANTPNNPITLLFEKIYTILAIVYISTTATINTEKILAQITGQRSVSYQFELKNISKNDGLYKIYSWIFTDGNATDKAIIARNVISLHCRYTNLIDIDDLAFATIQSNYNLYLRNNVNQYLELKNKVADYICDIISKTGDYATNIVDKFKQNLVAILGFLLTTLLANIVSANPLDNIFTKDITTLVYAILLGSIVFLVISIRETNYKIKTIEKAYNSLKENYIDILSENDIQEIFKKDKTFDDTKKEIQNKTRFFAIAWVSVIVLAFFVVEYLSDAPILWDHFWRFWNFLKNWVLSLFLKG